MSIDPLAQKYPSWSTYTFSGNRIIDARELEGLEPFVLFNNPDAAAENFSRLYNSRSIIDNREIVTKIYATTDMYGNTVYAYAEPVVSPNEAAARPSLVKLPNGTTEVAAAHTHSAYSPLYLNNEFSGIIGDATGNDDIGYAERHKVNIYVATPSGLFLKYDSNLDKIFKLGNDMPSDPKDPKRENKRNPIVPLVPPTPMPIVPNPNPAPTVTPPIIPTPAPTPAPLPVIIPKPIKT
ncbi:MAG: DUF4329 domain-containing protein [Flavobacterium sp.]